MNIKKVAVAVALALGVLAYRAVAQDRAGAMKLLNEKFDVLTVNEGKKALKDIRVCCYTYKANPGADAEYLSLHVCDIFRKVDGQRKHFETLLEFEAGMQGKDSFMKDAGNVVFVIDGKRTKFMGNTMTVMSDNDGNLMEKETPETVYNVRKVSNSWNYNHWKKFRFILEQVASSKDTMCYFEFLGGRVGFTVTQAMKDNIKDSLTVFDMMKNNPERLQGKTFNEVM